jgi:hypothetical protein
MKRKEIMKYRAIMQVIMHSNQFQSNELVTMENKIREQKEIDRKDDCNSTNTKYSHTLDTVEEIKWLYYF